MLKLTEDLSIIRLKPEDQPELLELMKEIYIPSYKHIWSDNGQWYLEQMYNPQAFQQDLANPNSHYFFIMFEGWKIGILKYDFPESPELINFPNALKLHRLYLSKDFQGRGIAAKLMKWVESVARERGLQYMWLEVMDTQLQAQKFYRKVGFEWIFTYHLDYKKMLTKYRGIQIWRKALN
ncbi:GNAT family N-acetyltransferase [Algoriphagus halophytocola]|uniref:GNAT family N-acetyltransferase n=1 Tax=Algoriphagus halophytocola TaxID=2991499 RepID=A0ABY6MI49_9BACT|nr:MULTISPECIES: GNAT family N-acetyltransferase [unclassified Algoriphagus]UZD23298.1 GNAT family N-acetyltransferase [Algoriphagus sp. TR-M5]WBL44592.1 GNAT family N-acetyltransferase [Algoriphagus sp. TR-M9]